LDTPAPPYSTANAPRNIPATPNGSSSGAPSRTNARAAFALVLAEVFGADELGGAVTDDPETEPDVDPEAEDDGVNEAKERLVGVAAAAQNFCTRASAEATSEGQEVRQVRKAEV